MLTLYPIVFPNSFIRLSNFLVESVGFFKSTIMSFANSDSLTFSFPIWMSFISCSYLIAMATTSNTVLNRSGESEQPCLVPDFRGKTFSFHPLSMMLAVGLSYMAFIMLIYASSMTALLSVFVINGCCTLSNAFSASIVMIMWFLSMNDNQVCLQEFLNQVESKPMGISFRII